MLGHVLGDGPVIGPVIGLGPMLGHVLGPVHGDGPVSVSC